MNLQILEEARCDLVKDVLRSSGTVRFRASGASMLPTLWPGDLLTIRSKNIMEAQVGDLVLTTSQRRFFVHRVVEKSNSGGDLVLITRGDAMPQADPPIREAELLGLVTEICRRGFVFAPSRKISPFRLIFSWVLRYSDLCGRVVLRLWGRRGANYDFALPERGNAF